MLLRSFPSPQVNFFGICHEPPCIVTEYAAYGSLAELLARARVEPAVADALTWQRRLAMVRLGGGKHGFGINRVTWHGGGLAGPCS